MKKIFAISTVMALTLFLLAASAVALPFNERPVYFNPEPPYPNEDSVQEALDRIITSDHFIDAVSDQEPAGLWTQTDGGAGGYAVSLFTSVSGTLGIYSAQNGQTVDLMTINAPDDPDAGGVGAGSDLISHFSISDTGYIALQGVNWLYDLGPVFSSFGFYWDPGSDNNRFYSQDALNTSGDSGLLDDEWNPCPSARLLAYLLETGMEVDRNSYGVYGQPWTFKAVGNDDWILTFEDGTDGDANDAIVLIEDMAAVPEPATMLLFGSVLIGLACLGRKRALPKCIGRAWVRWGRVA
jgi:hypothetical protein